MKSDNGREIEFKTGHFPCSNTFFFFTPFLPYVIEWHFQNKNVEQIELHYPMPGGYLGRRRFHQDENIYYDGVKGDNLSKEPGFFDRHEKEPILKFDDEVRSKIFRDFFPAAIKVFKDFVEGPLYETGQQKNNLPPDERDRLKILIKRVNRLYRVIEWRDASANEEQNAEKEISFQRLEDFNRFFKDILFHITEPNFLMNDDGLVMQKGKPVDNPRWKDLKNGKFAIDILNNQEPKIVQDLVKSLMTDFRFALMEVIPFTVMPDMLPQNKAGEILAQIPGGRLSSGAKTRVHRTFRAIDTQPFSPENEAGIGEIAHDLGQAIAEDKATGTVIKKLISECEGEAGDHGTVKNMEAALHRHLDAHGIGHWPSQSKSNAARFTMQMLAKVLSGTATLLNVSDANEVVLRPAAQQALALTA